MLYPSRARQDPRASFGLQINRSRRRCPARTDIVRLRSIGEDRASRYRRPSAHALANRVRVQESTDPAWMTGNQPDPPRTGRGEMACRCMPAGRENDMRPAMLHITAIAACRPRRVAIDHFSTPYQSDGCSGNRTRPVPRRSGDDAPCSPERGCCAALRRRIPADRVLAGTDRVRCRTGRTVHRRPSHAHFRKERASFARARPDKGPAGQRGVRNGCRMREVTKLKHAARGTRGPRGGPGLPDKAEQ